MCCLGFDLVFIYSFFFCLFVVSILFSFDSPSSNSERGQFWEVIAVLSSRLFSPSQGQGSYSQIPSSFSCCSHIGLCFPVYTCWRFWCSLVLRLLIPFSVDFLLSLLQRCMFHVVLRLLVVGLYLMYLVLAPAYWVCHLNALFLHGDLATLKTTQPPLPSSQNPLSCVDFQHVPLITWQLLTTLSERFLTVNELHDVFMCVCV